MEHADNNQSMLLTVAISGFRSLRQVVLQFGQLNLISGQNGSGKTSVYRSLRLLAATASDEVAGSLAKEGGLDSTLWAGPEKFSRGMLRGEVPVQGTIRKNPIALKLGFASDEYSYTIDLGLPPPSDDTLFQRDPAIKRECLWRGPTMRARDLCTDRRGQWLRFRADGGKWADVDAPLTASRSMLTEYVDPQNAPELMLVREVMRSWRFYDHFRTDADSPVRRANVGTFTPVLADDGSNLASALQTILEIGDSRGLKETVADAFPGSELQVVPHGANLEVHLEQHGMLRSMATAELSDGTLRFLLLAAALFTPRPPELMVLNEPETSLHPDLLPALARLIAGYAERHQVIIVSHSPVLIEALEQLDTCVHFQLEKTFGETQLLGVEPFDLPTWKWPPR